MSLKLNIKLIQVKQLEVKASMSEADQSQYESKYQALVEQQQLLTKDIETKQSEIKLRVALQKDTSATQAKQQATLNELKQKEAIAKERAQLLQVQVKRKSSAIGADSCTDHKSAI